MDNYLIEISDEESWSIKDVMQVCDKIPDNEWDSIVYILNSSDKEVSNLGYELFKSYKNG
jgi:hypothetical protein